MKNTSKPSWKNFVKKCWDGFSKKSKPTGQTTTSKSTTDGSNFDNTNNFEMIKDKTNPAMFQWVRGERMGQIVKSTGETVVDDNIEYLIFEDGSQCNMQLVGDWIVPINSINEPAFQAEPPRKPHTNLQDNNMMVSQSQERKSNPVFDLLDRSKKKSVKMEVSITVNMPSDELIKVIEDSYENGTKMIGEYLIASIDQKTLMKQVESILFKKVEEVTKKKKRNHESAI